MSKRTDNQNNSLHLYCEWVAEALNNSGYDVRLVLVGDLEKKIMKLVLAKCPQIHEEIEEIFIRFHSKISISWTKTSVKENIWRPIQISMFDERSSANVEKMNYGKIYEEMSRLLAQKFGIDVPWPSEETLEKQHKSNG